MSNEKSLSRIERSLGNLSEVQAKICARLEELEAGLRRLEGRRSGSSKYGEPGRDEVIRFLDGFRAAEALGEASTGAWIAVSTTGCVRGGLRVVQMREGMHARLLEQRIKELGGSPAHEVPLEVQEQVMREAGDADKPDAQKVLGFVQRFPDPQAALQPIHEMADRLEHDPETQSLLRTIAQDECATLEFFKNVCSTLNP
jgi:hypothetical protein